MKLVTFNIQYGTGADGRVDLRRTAAAVADADVIALQEVDRHWRRSGLRDGPAEIAAALPDHHWVFGANLDMDASTRDAAGSLVNRRKQFGTMLLSRWPIVSSRNFPLPKLGATNQHSIQQGALEGVIAAPSGPLRVYSVHLSHLSCEARLPQVEALLAIHSRAPDEGGAWCGTHPEPTSGWLEEDEPPMPRSAILMGDLNFTADGPEFDRIVGPNSPRFGRVNHRAGFVDSWVAAGHAEASGSTLPPTRTAGPTDQRIDYCFVTPDLAGHVTRAWVDHTCEASDHWPYWVELDR